MDVDVEVDIDDTQPHALAVPTATEENPIISPEEERKLQERNFKKAVSKPSVPVSTGETPTVCPICSEKYSARRKRLACPYSCGGEACIGCHHKYLMGNSTEFHCMSCRREWQMRFVRTHFSDRMLRELYSQYQKVLLARDESLLPAAQTIIENQERLKQFDADIAALQNQMNGMYKRKREFNASIGAVETKTERCVKCPLAECRGYLKRGICGLCHFRVCLKCMQKVDRKKDHKGDDEVEIAGHVCRKEDLENMAFLRENSRPCPKCGIHIMKADGCNQMWCVHCETKWDWQSGQVITGTFHNPHFFDWQRKNHGRVARDPNDVLCGGLPDFVNKKPDLPDAVFLNKVLRQIRHVHAEFTQEYQRPRMDDTCGLRLQYLRHKISKDEWGAELLKRYKAFKIHEQFFQVHQMFEMAATDIFQRRLGNNIDPEGARKEFCALRIYYNRELLNVARVNKGKYSRRYNLISSRWESVNWRHEKTVQEAMDLIV